KGGRSWAKTASKRKEDEKGRVFILLRTDFATSTSCCLALIESSPSTKHNMIVGESGVGLLRHSTRDRSMLGAI
ncbi:unnamed protein product, partial [Musa hybrid cultivar]